MHSTSEFVVVKDVEDSLNLALGVVNELGLNKFGYTYIRPTYDYYGQGNLFNSEDEEYNYESVDWEESDNHYFNISDDSIEIESKSNGDTITLNMKDMADLYLLIRERLLENEEI